MSKKSSGGYEGLITPLTTPLKKGDPRDPVHNPPVVSPRDPLGLLPSKGGKKK